MSINNKSYFYIDTKSKTKGKLANIIWSKKNSFLIFIIQTKPDPILFFHRYYYFRKKIIKFFENVTKSSIKKYAFQFILYMTTYYQSRVYSDDKNRSNILKSV